MADNLTNTNSSITGTPLTNDKEPATTHDVAEGGILGAVGGAIVGGLAGGPLGAIIGAVVGGGASAGAVDVVDKHDHDYDRTVAGTHTSAMDDDETVNDHLRDASFATTTAPIGYTNTPSRTDNTAAYSTAAPQSTMAGSRTVDGEVVVPIVEEELEIGKRQVQSGGARIRTDVIETPVEQSVNLREEHVTVDRHAVDRPVTDTDAAFKEQSYEVTETAEVPIISKTARVVEEVVIGKTATDRVETVHDTVRRTDVDVEELDNTPTRPNNF
ncbi:MAG: YsnF/AvaK domain-containing protein [Janthinobacterium lividum]